MIKDNLKKQLKYKDQLREKVFGIFLIHKILTSNI